MLLLIPSPIATPALSTVPKSTLEAILSCDTFVCERIRTTRRWIKPLMTQEQFDRFHFIEIDKHQPTAYVSDGMKYLKAGQTLGIISEAGLPCVGDPGAELVMAAHRGGVAVRPISGANSFLLALMASGFNGQSFTFHGYLPHDIAQLGKRLQSLLQAIKNTGYTQLFMEAPYRHQRLLKALGQHLPKHQLLHISINADSEAAYHKTQSVGDWLRELDRFDEKVQAVYVLGRI